MDGWERPNVILITVDNLRADHTSLNGYSRSTTPGLERLARDGILFKQAISEGGRTLFAFEPILASVSPPLKRSQLSQCHRTRQSIAQVMKANGYNTGAFLSNIHNFGFYHYDEGFDYFDDTWTPADLWMKRVKNLFAPVKSVHVIRRLVQTWRRKLPWLTAEETTERAAAWLREHPRQSFLWMHIMSAHPPLVVPDEFVREFCGRPISTWRMYSLAQKRMNNPYGLSYEEKELLADLYDASIRYVDSAITRFLERVEAISGKGNTAVIVMADHGDGLGERPNGDNVLYESNIHVPLLIHYAALAEKGVVVEQQVGTTQIPPTILEMAGLDASPEFQGESLLPVARGERPGPETIMTSTMDFYTNSSYFSCRGEKWKMLVGDGEPDRLYNLEDDPEETNNVADAESEIAGQKKQRIQEFAARVNARFADALPAS